MREVIDSIDETMVNSNDIEFYNTIKIEISDHIQTIMDEVNSLQDKFEGQKHADFLKR